MANEITAAVKVAVSKGTLKQSRDSSSQQINMSGTHVAAGAMDVPTTAGGTVIPLGSVATAGVAFVRNLDATNFATIGIVVSATFYPVVKLKPGEAWAFRLGTNAPYARADTATVVLEYGILED